MAETESQRIRREQREEIARRNKEKERQDSFEADAEALARQKAREVRKTKDRALVPVGSDSEGSVFRDYRGTEGVVDDAAGK